MPECIDLFCGAGGLTHGFIKAGIPVLAGVDLDSACKFPFEKNNNAEFIQKDISKVSVKELNSRFTPGEIKILAGCAPCQPFSTYSQRYDSNRDEKWALLKEFARLASGIKPDILTMENVPSLVRHDVFLSFVDSLKHMRYKIWYGIVNCDQYGVPQSRKRLVLLASRLGEIGIIQPTHPKPVTVKRAIGRLRPIKAGEAAPRDRLHTSASLSDINLERIRFSRPGGTWRDWPKHLVADCHKVESGKTYAGVYGRMEWNKPGPTVTTQCFGYGNGRFGHPEQNRALSLREAAILQGFPREYKFLDKKQKVEFTTLGRLIGNAVPVGLGEVIAKSILLHLENL